MTEQLLGVFAVWGTLSFLDFFLTCPRWMWYLLATAMGLGWELLGDPSTWWFGLGVAGAALFLWLVVDLIVVVTDQAKVAVLRQGRRSM